MILDICGGRHNFFGDRLIGHFPTGKKVGSKKISKKSCFFFFQIFPKFDRFEKHFILIFYAPAIMVFFLTGAPGGSSQCLALFILRWASGGSKNLGGSKIFFRLRRAH